MINRFTTWLKTRLGYHETGTGTTYLQFRFFGRYIALSVTDGRPPVGAIEEVEG